MKKIFLIAALGVAGLASANNVDLKKDDHKEKTEKKKADANQDDPGSKMQCVQVGMLVWCTDEVIPDTVCWGSGSGTSTYQQAMADSIHNSQLITEFYCGAGTGSGPGGGN